MIKLRYIEDAKASFAKRADVLDDFGRPRVSYMSPTSLWYNSGSRSFLGLVSTVGKFCSLPSRQHGPVRSCACVPVSSQRFRSNGLKRYADLMDHVHATSCAEGVFQFVSHAQRYLEELSGLLAHEESHASCLEAGASSSAQPFEQR